MSNTASTERRLDHGIERHAQPRRLERHGVEHRDRGVEQTQKLNAATDHTAHVINLDQRALGAANDRIRIAIHAVSKLAAISIR